MLHQMLVRMSRFAFVMLAGISLAHAHHAMDYATPATLLDGLLSGLGHPVIGIDHLLFIAGAGVLAARIERGWTLPLVFVAASIAAVGLRYLGYTAAVDERWVAASLLVLGALLLVARPGRAPVAGLFLIAGGLHGGALAQAIVGAEATPLAAYLTGLAIVQCAIALAVWWAAKRLAALRRGEWVQRLAGATVGIAGLGFVALALIGQS